MDLLEYMLALSKKGYYCSQILMKLALAHDGADDPALIRAMSGLNGGLGFCQKTCGVLTAGCCVIGYFAGKGEDDELPASNLNGMIGEFVHWFENEAAGPYGSDQCEAILGGNPANQLTICPGLVESAFAKLMEILENGGALA